jgi:hypothetical protein
LITPLGATSFTYRIKIRVFNNAGSTYSNPLSVVLAGVLLIPASGPVSDSDVTDNSRIKVLFGPLLAVNN